MTVYPISQEDLWNNIDQFITAERENARGDYTIKLKTQIRQLLEKIFFLMDAVRIHKYVDLFDENEDGPNGKPPLQSRLNKIELGTYEQGIYGNPVVKYSVDGFQNPGWVRVNQGPTPYGAALFKWYMNAEMKKREFYSNFLDNLNQPAARRSRSRSRSRVLRQTKLRRLKPKPTQRKRKRRVYTK